MPKKNLPKLLLSSAYNKAEVAVRYYEKVAPGKYDREAARKQFVQDSEIDAAVLLDVTTAIHEEQKEIFSTYAEIMLLQR